MKIPRFVKEYATWKANKLYEKSLDENGHVVDENLFKRSNKCAYYVRMASDGLASIDEVMTAIAEI